MKKIVAILFMFNFISIYSQVGINTQTPSSAAVLHIEALNVSTATMGGYLMPVVTEAQRDVIPVDLTSDADDGLQIFLNDIPSGKKCWQVFDSFAQVWRDIYCSNGGTTPDCAANPIVLYSEDFESYAEDTGVTGASATNGDYPGSVSKWTLTSYNGAGSSTPAYPGTLMNADDYALIKTISGSKSLEIQDVNGPFRFQTQAIDINGYLDINISMNIRETGSLEYYNAEHTSDFDCGEESYGSDYVDIEYSTDGGASYTEVPNFSGFGNANHTLNDNLNTAVNFSLSGISGTSLIIRIRFQNWAAAEQYYLDNIRVTCN